MIALVEKLTIENESVKQKLLFDMDNADYLLYEGGSDWGSISVDHESFRFPTQTGETITFSAIGTRDISIAGWIIGKTLAEIEKKKRTLSVVINPMQEIHIDVGSYRLDGKPSSNVTYSKTYQENNDVMCKFLIQVFCPFPLFKYRGGIEKTSETITGMFHFPLIIHKNLPVTNGLTFSKIKNERFVDILNDGTVAVGCTITMRVANKRNAIVNNPTLINISTRQQIKINKVLQIGEAVIINTTKGQRDVIGGVNGKYQNYLDYFDLDNTWLEIPVGMSTYTVRTYNAAGNPDDTYKYLDLSIVYAPCKFNLDEE